MDEYGVGLPSGGSYGGSSGDWGGFMNAVTSLGKTYIETKYSPDVQLQKMQLQAYGPYGQPYIEGIPNKIGVGGIPTAWLLIGGAVLLAVVLVKN